MKKIFVLFALTLTLFVSAQTTWKTNFEEAKKEAIDTNKKILVVFSGSDWCLPCIKLKKEVLETPEFEEYASNKWIILSCDFPNKKKNKEKQSSELIKQNKEMAEKYNKEGMFPRMVAFEADGTRIDDIFFTNQNTTELIDLIAKHE